MSLDGKLLARAKTKLDRERAENHESFQRRMREAYEKNPRLAEIDAELRSTVADAIGFALSRGGDPEEAFEQIRDHNLSLQEERGRELLRVGLPVDHLEEKYMCKRCRDTGYNGTELCECLLRRYREEQRRELSGLLKLGSETFDHFDLSLYDDQPDPNTGISPRRNMEFVYEICVEYARKFSSESMNLFLSGGTGLGKTFLSTCIAKIVSEQGFSVVYDTAGSVFSKYEECKFTRFSDDIEAVRAYVRRMETCDLFILDDLGTEMSSSFVTSALYTLLNTRLTTGKKTIISSNLTIEELGKRYSAPILSRLQGEYNVLKFYGRDIRLLKQICQKHS